jgi:hypothetical protein
MFIGHFAVGLAGRRLTPKAGLGTWFLSATFLDVVWPVFLLLGFEHARIVTSPPNAFLQLDFYDYPISHSLVGAIGWAVLFGAAWWVAKRSPRGAALLGAGVFSHWILDVATHRPDLPLLAHGPYVGLGLWNRPALTMVVESALFVGGIIIYARGRRPGVSFWLLVAVLYALYIVSVVAPPPPSITAVAWTAMVGWLFFVWAWFADRRRT